MRNENPERFDAFASLYERYVGIVQGTPWFGWDDLQGERALDVGCGAGNTTEYLAERFMHVVGFDLSAESIRLAHNKHKRANIEYMQSDLFDFHPEKTFDYVYSHTMMHHIEPYREGLETIKRFVKDGGKLFIIDNVSDTYRTPPIQGYLLSATRRFVPNIKKFGLRNAWFLLRFWYNPHWLRHLASDRYLTRVEFRNTYLDVFPHAEIVDVGFALAMKWVNMNDRS